AQILTPIFELNHAAGLEAANMYYGRDAQQRKSAAGLLAAHKITDDMILAKALAQVGGHVVDIDRLIAARERSRNNLFKDHQRRRESAAKIAKIDQAKETEANPSNADRVHAGKDAALKYQ